MKRSYHIEESEGKSCGRVEELTRVLSRNGQALLPLLELVAECRGAVDEIIDVAGRAAIQAVLELSAQEATGEALRQPGKRRAGEVVRWGRQGGRVSLSDRKLRVARPRLRSRAGEEVAVPAYTAMQRDERLGERMLEILLSGCRRGTTRASSPRWRPVTPATTTTRRSPTSTTSSPRATATPSSSRRTRPPP